MFQGRINVQATYLNVNGIFDGKVNGSFVGTINSERVSQLLNGHVNGEIVGQFTTGKINLLVFKAELRGFFDGNVDGLFIGFVAETS